MTQRPFRHSLTSRKPSKSSDFQLDKSLQKSPWELVDILKSRRASQGRERFPLERVCRNLFTGRLGAACPLVCGPGKVIGANSPLAERYMVALSLQRLECSRKWACRMALEWGVSSCLLCTTQNAQLCGYLKCEQRLKSWEKLLSFVESTDANCNNKWALETE